MTAPPASSRGTTHPGGARRRMLRGAFALPVMATVHPGTAWSQSVMQCLVNTLNPQNGGTAFSNWGPVATPDGVIRVPIYGSQQQSTECKATYWVRQTDLSGGLVVAGGGDPISAVVEGDAGLTFVNGYASLAASAISGDASTATTSTSSGTSGGSSTELSYFSSLMLGGSTTDAQVASPSITSNCTVSLDNAGNPDKLVGYVAVVFDQSGALIGVGQPAITTDLGVASLACLESLRASA